MAKKTSSPSTEAPKKKASTTNSPLLQAKAVLQKVFKSSDWHANLDSKTSKQSLPHLSTGSIIIDHLIGGKPNDQGIPPCPGIPRGKIFNLYGHESSGKTTLALTASAQTIRNGGTVCYIDWEHEIVPSYAKSLGVPIEDGSKFMLAQPETLEQGIAILFAMAAVKVDLVVLDSVGAGVPKAQFEKSLQDKTAPARVGLNAAIWSQQLPEIKSYCHRSGTAVIGISQIRDAINTGGPQYGDTITVQGGKAWKFYSAVRMRLKRVSTEKSSDYSAIVNKATDRVVGAKIRAKLDKCKISSQQGNEEDFYIRWGAGIDDLRSLIEIAIAHGCATKNAASFTWIAPDGTEHKRVGIEKFRQMFAESSSLAKLLEKQVKPFMASGGTGHGKGYGDADDDVNEAFDEEAEISGVKMEDLSNVLDSIMSTKDNDT